MSDSHEVYEGDGKAFVYMLIALTVIGSIMLVMLL